MMAHHPEFNSASAVGAASSSYNARITLKRWEDDPQRIMGVSVAKKREGTESERLTSVPKCFKFGALLNGTRRHTKKITGPSWAAAIFSYTMVLLCLRDCWQITATPAEKLESISARLELTIRFTSLRAHITNAVSLSNCAHWNALPLAIFLSLFTFPNGLRLTFALFHRNSDREFYNFGASKPVDQCF